MLKLETMSDPDFQLYLRRAIPQYAYDQVRGGNWTPEESVGRASAEFRQSLTNGPQTEGHYLLTIFDEKGAKVGMIWWAMNQRGKQKIAFLADFFIFGEFRHKGYEKEALALLEEHARAQGATRMELQIFAHNAEDRDMYKASDFGEVSVYFGKNI